MQDFRAIPQVTFLIIFFILAVPAARAQKAADTIPLEQYVSVNAGCYNIFDNGERTGYLDIRYHSKAKFLVFRPCAGLLLGFDGSLFLYTGVEIPLHLTSRLMVRPMACLGFYRPGSTFDLGYPLEFRTGVNLTFTMKKGLLLGLEFSHISNTGFWAEHNPGTETVGLILMIPVRRSSQVKVGDHKTGENH